MKKLLCLSALIIYIFACCPSSTTKPPTPIAEPPTAQPSPVPSEPTDTPVPLPLPTDTLLPIDTPFPTDTTAPSQPTAKVTAPTLNVRAGPGTDYPTVGQLSLDNLVDVVGRNAANDWLQIVYPANSDGRAWIAAAHAELTSSLETVPEISASPPPAPTDTSLSPARVQAQVVSIIDGDTIEVSIEGQTYKVRYIGIDTPETKHPDKPVEPFGPEATAKNEELVGEKIVELEKDVSETDQYGRLLRYVYVGDLMVNAELVRLGYAQVSTYPPDVKHQDLFLQLQEEAREASRGLWGALSESTPEPIALPTEPAALPAGDVRITFIFYDGAVKQVESDEYAEIANAGMAPVDLGGWLLNAGDPGQDFVFSDFVLEPGQACRVYTNEHHPDSGGFSFGSSRAIWNNKGDCGYLYNANREPVSEYCY